MSSDGDDIQKTSKSLPWYCSWLWYDRQSSAAVEDIRIQFTAHLFEVHVELLCIGTLDVSELIKNQYAPFLFMGPPLHSGGRGVWWRHRHYEDNISDMQAQVHRLARMDCVHLWSIEGQGTTIQCDNNNVSGPLKIGLTIFLRFYN